MSHLSVREINEVWAMRPDTLAKATKVMADFERETGRQLYIPAHGGKRSRVRQAALRADSLKAGGGVLAYPVADPDRAPHVLGAGIDFHIVGGRNDNDNPDPLYEKLAEIGERHGLRAGYRWTGKKRDVFHFEEKEAPAVWRSKWDALVRVRVAEARSWLSAPVLEEAG